MEISAKTLHFIEEHREDDTRTLALQSKKYPDVDMAAAVRPKEGANGLAVDVRYCQDEFPKYRCSMRRNGKPSYVRSLGQET